jgi:hypothetical protein
MAAFGMLLAAGAVAVAQDAPMRWGGDRHLSAPLRRGLPDRHAGFTFCRLWYDSVTQEQGGLGWSTDYPGSDHNFLGRLKQYTTTDISRFTDGQPGYAVFRADDPDLLGCPFLFASDAGTAGFSDSEIKGLREYLLKGGILWADDFWGEYAWSRFTDQMRRVLPQYEAIDIPPDHKILTQPYLVKSVPQIPAVQHWRRSGGQTSERGPETATPHLRAIFDETGRILVIMTHNTDIADGWEREGEELDYFDAFSPRAYGLGINIVMYVLTH